MLHYACIFWKNSCKLYTYSGKFPSLNRLYSGYVGKFLQDHLYIKLKIGAFPRGYIQPQLYPPRMSSLLHKKLDKKILKMFHSRECDGPPGPDPPAHLPARVPPTLPSTQV